MRTLTVLTNVGTLFYFDAPEGWEIETDIYDGRLRVGRAQPDPNRNFMEIARFNGGHWAWYRWEEATEPADE